MMFARRSIGPDICLAALKRPARRNAVKRRLQIGQPIRIGLAPSKLAVAAGVAHNSIRAGTAKRITKNLSGYDQALFSLKKRATDAIFGPLFRSNVLGEPVQQLRPGRLGVVGIVAGAVVGHEAVLGVRHDDEVRRCLA